MKLEDNEARVSILDLEDRLTKSNEELVKAINNFRLVCVGSTWIIVITAICIAVFK